MQQEGFWLEEPQSWEESLRQQSRQELIMGGEGKEETQLVILKTAGWRPPAGLCFFFSPPALKAWSELLLGGERPKLGLEGSGKRLQG